MVVSIRDDSKLQDPRVGNLPFDLSKLGVIHVGNSDFDLVVPDGANQQFFRPGRIETIGQRKHEVLSHDFCLCVSICRAIDRVDQVRPSHDFRSPLELETCIVSGLYNKTVGISRLDLSRIDQCQNQHQRSAKDRQKDPIKCAQVRWHSQLAGKQLAQKKRD